MKNGNILFFISNEHLTQIQTKAHRTWMILESSSKEFLQSPQYSWANCRMYLFTLAEVELIPPLLPDSSWNGGSKEESHMEAPHKNNNCRAASEARTALGRVKGSVSQPGGLGKLHLSPVTWGFSGAASFTLHRRFSSCGRCPISW